MLTLGAAREDAAQLGALVRVLGIKLRLFFFAEQQRRRVTRTIRRASSAKKLPR